MFIRKKEEKVKGGIKIGVYRAIMAYNSYTGVCILEHIIDQLLRAMRQWGYYP